MASVLPAGAVAGEQAPDGSRQVSRYTGMYLRYTTNVREL